MASAAIAAGGSILSSVLSGKGASKAAKIQAQAAQNALNLQKSEFDTTQANEQPFISGGTSALEQELRLLGLGDSNTGVSVNGNPALTAEQQQGGAIQNLTDSPLYQSIFGQGKDAVLQSAAATGGLRGGNVNNSLANFGSNLLYQTIQQQLQNLSGVAGTGVNAASGLASAGQNYADSSSKLLTQQGNANATAAAAPWTAAAGALNSAASSGSLSSLASLLGASTGGGGTSAGPGTPSFGAIFNGTF